MSLAADKESTGLTYGELGRLLNCHPLTVAKAINTPGFVGLNGCQRQLLSYCANRCDEDEVYKSRLKLAARSDSYVDLLRKAIN